jgi:hypothetical protein
LHTFCFAAGVQEEVESLYSKANSVFPMALEEHTEACFDDLQVFFLCGNTRREELTSTDSADVQLWSVQREQLESKVRGNNDGIAASEGKIKDWKALIAKEEHNVNVHKNVSYLCPSNPITCMRITQTHLFLLLGQGDVHETNRQAQLRCS